MVRHVIIWDLKEGLTDRESVKAEIKQKLEALAGVVPGLAEIHVYTDLLDSSKGDLMLDSLFESREALAGYQIHPEHLKAAEVVRGAASHRSCADIEI
ncbi:Stress responsive A/B Barrel Domain [Ruminococcaceae bacterium FB2012]|nr:Stress responsive A/B Barrel Domain [Ruminococcaceae bacterium FB2012]